MTSQSSGVGRGRGWLKLNKNAPVRPGEPAIPVVINGPPLTPVIDVQPPNLSIMNSVVPQHAKLISFINQLSSNDDGIMLNQKLKFILDTWSQECLTPEDVEESFNYIYQKSLEDEVFSLKVVLMVSSFSFIRSEVCQKKIRSLFIAKTQDTFEGAKDLQIKNPNVFRIAVHMLSEFYYRARLCDGRPIKLLASPLICYFSMLLSSAQPADLELFTTLLYLNGSCIKTDCGQKLNELLNKVRQLLICNVELTQTCKLYLLLAIDIANNRFTLLPSDVYKFYQDQLGDKITAHFQGSLGVLSIQTQQSSKTLDSYQSNVNVLQVTPPDSTSPINELVPQIPVKPNMYGFNTNFGVEPGISVGTWENDNKDKAGGVSVREKTGRPILGAGARLHKSVKEDSNWRNHGRDNTSDWSNKPKGHATPGWNGGEKKPHNKNFNKGWEHDDRFENDYN